jgi:DNA-binding NarL/FixJ family response regulator
VETFSAPVRVLIVDDEPDIRTMLRMQFRYDPRFEVAGEAVDGQGALEACEALDPDLIVLDVRMPRLNGLLALPLLRERCPRSKVALYTAFGPGANEEFVRSQDAVILDKNMPLRWLADQLFEFSQRED